MTTYITDKNGVQYDIEKIGGIRVLDDGQEVDKVELDGSHRKLLDIAHHGIATDYSYMPINSRDMTQSVALDMMVDGGAFTIAKGLAGVAGFFLSAGNPIGAGIGIMLAEAGTETWQWAKAINGDDDPYRFWNKFTENLQEAAKTDYSISRHLSEAGVGMSFTGLGAKNAVYKEWGDILGEKQYNISNALGLIVHSAAGSIAMSGQNAPTAFGMIGESMLSDSVREATETLGVTGDLVDAMKVGAIHAVSSGVTGAIFMKAIPTVAAKYFPDINSKVNQSGFFTAATRGMEMAGYGTAYNATVAIANDTDEYFDPVSTAIMFGLGAGLGKLAHKINHKDPVDSPVIPEQKDYWKNIFDNTEVKYTKQQEAMVTDSYYNSKLATGDIGNGTMTLADKIRKDFFDSKGLEMSKDTAENIGKRMFVRNPAIAESWGRAPRKPSFDVNKAMSTPESISNEAKKVVAEEIDTMVAHGIISSAEEAENIAESVIRVAKQNSKGKHIGNFEIRKAMEEFMEWNRRY